MRRSMSAKRYPPLLGWVELGAIAAAPLEDVSVVAPVGGAWDVVVSVGAVVACSDVVGVVVVACELVVVTVSVDVPVVVGVVAVSVDVPVVVDAAASDDVGVLDDVVEAAGNGAPGVGGSVEAFGPVTSAPFFAVISTNAAESGAWILESAPATLPWCPAARYPTAPGGGRTRPIAEASRSIR